MALVTRIPKGAPLTAAEMDNNLTYLQGLINAGTSGTSGTAGTSGGTGSTGTAGSGGTSGSGGSSGTAGTAGSGGTSGTAGTAGSGGTSGVTGDLFTSTASDSHSITVGAKTFTIATGLSWTPGQQTIISYDSNNLLNATVTTYNSGTGQFIVNVTTVVGSGGPFASWNINTAGATGQAGTSGSGGTSGVNGTSGSGGTSGVNGTSGSGGTSGINGTAGSAGSTGTA